jgi:hypothetical protein
MDELFKIVAECAFLQRCLDKIQEKRCSNTEEACAVLLQRCLEVEEKLQNDWLNKSAVRLDGKPHRLRIISNAIIRCLWMLILNRTSSIRWKPQNPIFFSGYAHWWRAECFIIQKSSSEEIQILRISCSMHKKFVALWRFACRLNSEFLLHKWFYLGYHKRPKAISNVGRLKGLYGAKKFIP